MAPDLKAGRGLEQTLELLRGPTDERRFVGLLMAAKTLPAGDEEAMQSVYSAVGATFFKRLLLPLQSSGQASTQEPERLQKTAAMSALGLAILSSLCQSVQLAQSQEMIDLIPVFVKVAKAGGVNPLLGAVSTAQEAMHTDSLAAQDALQCLLRIVSASHEGRQRALKANTMPALCTALQSERSQKLWAVRLLIALLGAPACSKAGQEKAVVGISGVVPHLATMLGSEGTAAVKGEAPGQVSGNNPAEVQLEIVHALLLLLPLSSKAEEARLHEMAQRGQAMWMLDAQKGLQVLLQAKMGPSQRQAVLQLVAYLSQFASSAWLLGGNDPMFFILLVELTKVEIILLLRDALQPESFIPTSWEPSAPAEQPESYTAAGDDKSFSSTPLEDHLVGQSPFERSAECRRRIEVMEVDTSRRTGESGETAGERAARSLPAMLQLFEDLVQALAEVEEESSTGLKDALSSCISTAVAGRAMSSLTDAAEAILQFLEELRSQKREDLTALAACRAVSRFLAEAPHFENDRVRRMLPWLAQMREGVGLPYLLPSLLQLTDPDILPEAELSKWLQAAAAPEVWLAVARQVGGLTGSGQTDGSLYFACSLMVHVLSSRYFARGSDKLTSGALAATKALSAWTCQRFAHNAESSTAESSVEPRLLSYIGRLVAIGVAASGTTGEGTSLSSEELEEASRTTLIALEVGDVLLGMGDARAAQKPFDLSAMKLEEGTKQRLSKMEVDEEVDDLVSEVRVQQIATLRLGRELLETNSVFRGVARQSRWCQVAADSVAGMRTRSQYKRLLAEFCDLATKQ